MGEIIRDVADPTRRTALRAPYKTTHNNVINNNNNNNNINDDDGYDGNGYNEEEEEEDYDRSRGGRKHGDSIIVDRMNGRISGDKVMDGSFMKGSIMNGSIMNGGMMNGISGMIPNTRKVIRNNKEEDEEEGDVELALTLRHSNDDDIRI